MKLNLKMINQIKIINKIPNKKQMNGTLNYNKFQDTSKKRDLQNQKINKIVLIIKIKTTKKLMMIQMIQKKKWPNLKLG